MKKNSLKRSLFLSVLSLFLCFSMLVGTTFAWFTDSVTSANNIIVAGNLDVELYNAIGVDANKKVDSNTKLFEEVVLWEPGAVAVENLTVANEGTLALKYKLSANIANAKGKANLADVLKVGIVEGGITATDRDALINSVTEWMEFKSFAREGQLEAGTTAPTTKTYGIVIWWEPSANDNAYNMNNGETEKLSIELGVNLFATQATVEEDSFDNQYDDAAWVVANADATAKNQAELDAALANGGLVALAGDISGDLVIDNVAEGTILNFAGSTVNGTVTVAEGQKITLNGQGGIAATGTAPALKVGKDADVTIAGGTFTSENVAISVTNRTEAPMLLTIEEGTVITAPTIINLDQTSNYAGAEIVINGGEFNSTYTKSDARPIKVHGGDVTINGGTFTIDNPTGGNCYFVDVSSTYNTANDGTNKYVMGKVEINGGTFEFTAENSYLVDVPGNVVVNDCTFIGVKAANVFNISSTNPADQTITVNGGNYTVRTSPAGCFNYTYANRVILKGGTINSNKKLTDSLADGYKVVDNGNGTWTVTAN